MERARKYMFIYVTLGVKKKCCSSVLSVCQHDLAIQSVSTPSYARVEMLGDTTRRTLGLMPRRAVAVACWALPTIPRPSPQSQRCC